MDERHEDGAVVIDYPAGLKAIMHQKGHITVADLQALRHTLSRDELEQARIFYVLDPKRYAALCDVLIDQDQFLEDFKAGLKIHTDSQCAKFLKRSGLSFDLKSYMEVMRNLFLSHKMKAFGVALSLLPTNYEVVDGFIFRVIFHFLKVKSLTEITHDDDEEYKKDLEETNKAEHAKRFALCETALAQQTWSGLAVLELMFCSDLMYKLVWNEDRLLFTKMIYLYVDCCKVKALLSAFELFLSPKNTYLFVYDKKNDAGHNFDTRCHQLYMKYQLYTELQTLDVSKLADYQTKSGFLHSSEEKAALMELIKMVQNANVYSTIAFEELQSLDKKLETYLRHFMPM